MRVARIACQASAFWLPLPSGERGPERARRLRTTSHAARCLMSDILSKRLPDSVLSDRAYLEIPSQPDWIEPTVEFLKQRALLCGACQEGRAGRLIIALHEALTNSIVHGNLEISSRVKEQSDQAFARLLAERASTPEYGERTVTIEMNYDGQKCQWVLTDQGKGFDVDSQLNKDIPDEAEMFLASGRGILLMRAFLDGVEYESGGTRVILTLDRLSGEERREHTRHVSHHAVHIAPIRIDGSVDWDAAYEGIAQNCSETGMGLVQSRLSRTDRVLIGVESRGETTYVPAQVRHCRVIEDGLIELGCQFQVGGASAAESTSTEPVEMAMESFMQELQESPEEFEEKRKSPREAYTEQIEVWDDQGNCLQAIARNLSRTGMAFVTSRSVPPQESRIICLPQRHGESLRLRARVVRCTQLHQGFFDVGVRFLSLQTSE